MPGEARGRISVKAKAPALPAEAPAAGPSRSITVTESPRAWAASAAESPTTPAPMTITPAISSGRVFQRLRLLGPIRIPRIEQRQLRLDETGLRGGQRIGFVEMQPIGGLALHHQHMLEEQHQIGTGIDLGH